MARPKRTAPGVAIRDASKKAARPGVVDWRRDPIIVRLTAKVHGLLGAAARRSAEDVVTIGGHLKQVHERLPHGQWLDWVDANAPFSRKTADNYIDLAEWARRMPAQFARFRHLGPGKLYVLAKAPKQRVAALRPGKLVAIPGAPRKKSIETMSAVELGAVIGDLAPPPAVPVVPIDAVVQRVRFEIAALGAAADVMVARIDEVSSSLVKELAAELAGVLERLDAAARG